MLSTHKAAVRRLLLHRRQAVRVGVEGRRDAGVAAALALREQITVAQPGGRSWSRIERASPDGRRPRRQGRPDARLSRHALVHLELRELIRAGGEPGRRAGASTRAFVYRWAALPPAVCRPAGALPAWRKRRWIAPRSTPTIASSSANPSAVFNSRSTSWAAWRHTSWPRAN